MTRYSIHHTTSIVYSEPVREAKMELRLRPSSRERQILIDHEIAVDPEAPLLSYPDSFGNEVQHFDVPRTHASVTVTSRAIVEVEPPGPLPDALGPEDWLELDRLADTEDLWPFLVSSSCAAPSRSLDEFAVEVNARRRDDPLTLVLQLCGHLHSAFEFRPASTSVDSAIDLVLEQRAGVSQDFAHLYLALLRGVGIPARYVSGYLCAAQPIASTGRGPGDDASHAWVEVRLPRLGWVGVDPSIGSTVGASHIRIAVGRDYGDVPPTRGAFKGPAESEIEVAVRVDAVGEVAHAG